MTPARRGPAHRIFKGEEAFGRSEAMGEHASGAAAILEGIAIQVPMISKPTPGGGKCFGRRGSAPAARAPRWGREGGGLGPPPMAGAQKNWWRVDFVRRRTVSAGPWTRCLARQMIAG